MKPRLLDLALAATFVALQSCNPLASGGTLGGQCETTDGNVVDTYTITGSWKKTSGYDTVRSKNELALNYDVLLVQAGTPFCYVRVANGAQESTTVKGSYEQSVDKRDVTFEYEIGEGAPATRNAKYSFTGSCDGTVMTLTYDDGAIEKYSVLSKDVTQINCSPDSGSGGF